MNKRIKKKKGLSKITNQEVWGLDVTLAKYILPRLQKFKQINTMSHPTDFKNIEEWHKVIDKMIYSFNYVIQNNIGTIHGDLSEKVEYFKKYEEGMNLFARYFKDLWD